MVAPAGFAGLGLLPGGGPGFLIGRWAGRALPQVRRGVGRGGWAGPSAFPEVGLRVNPPYSRKSGGGSCCPAPAWVDEESGRPAAVGVLYSVLKSRISVSQRSLSSFCFKANLEDKRKEEMLPSYRNLRQSFRKPGAELLTVQVSFALRLAEGFGVNLNKGEETRPQVPITVWRWNTPFLIIFVILVGVMGFHCSIYH